MLLPPTGLVTLYLVFMHASIAFAVQPQGLQFTIAVGLQWVLNGVMFKG